jgi:hypothetical protein
MALYSVVATGRDEGARGSAPTPRDLAFQRARTRVGDADAALLVAPPADPGGTLSGRRVTCRFVPQFPRGTTPKFDCALPDGEVVRVKYGHEPEINAEVAATRLLTALGYAADREYMVPQLRCYGCPPNPFVVMRFLDLAGRKDGEGLGLFSDPAKYTDFDWVAVERRFDGAPIEDDGHKGWAWWELKNVAAPTADLDALRLVAVFLAHWDNKEDNQRLVCMDSGARAADQVCADPVLMIQDLGATFGPMKVNVAEWDAMPVWIDRAACAVSMRALPYAGSTFPDARIAEAARLRIGSDLASLSDAELRAWFAAARFPEFYTATSDDKDLEMWTRVFRHRVDQIVSAGPCPQ